MRAQPRVSPNGDQCRHPQPMAQARISERKAPRAGERALARLPQTRHHADVACERGGIPKSARVAQLCDQARGSSRSDAVNGGKEFANFVSLEACARFLGRAASLDSSRAPYPSTCI